MLQRIFISKVENLICVPNKLIATTDKTQKTNMRTKSSKIVYCGERVSFFRLKNTFNYLPFLVNFKIKIKIPGFDEEEYSSEMDEEGCQNLGNEVANQIITEDDQLMEGNSSLLAKSQPIR